MSLTGLLASASFVYHGFFFVLFIQRMAPLLSRKAALHASDPFVAEARFYLQAFGGVAKSISAESIGGLFTQLGGQLFGFDPNTSAGNATALAVAKFMVLYEIGEGTVHGWVMVSALGVQLSASSLWWARSFFAAKLVCFAVWGIPYVGAHSMLWCAAVRSGPALVLRQLGARTTAEAAASLSFHLGAVAFGVLATTACCFVFSGIVLLLSAPAAQLSPLAAALAMATLGASTLCGLPCTLRSLLPWALGKLQPPTVAAAQHAYPVSEEPGRAKVE